MEQPVLLFFLFNIAIPVRYLSQVNATCIYMCIYIRLTINLIKKPTNYIPSVIVVHALFHTSLIF